MTVATCDYIEDQIMQLGSCSLLFYMVEWIVLSVLQLLKHTPGSTLQNLVLGCCVLTQELGFDWLLVGKHI